MDDTIAKKTTALWGVPQQKPENGRVWRHTKGEKLKPFLKWAGGKGQLLDEIRMRYPAELGNSINRYAEPFVGGGAVLFDVLSNYDIDEVYIGDTNAELIHVYRTLRDDSNDLIDMLKQLENAPLSGVSI